MHFVIFVEQIQAQLHDFEFKGVSQCDEYLKQDFKMLIVGNFCRSLDRLSNYHRVCCMPDVKKFRVEPPNNNITHIILRLRHGLSRGLVVRIRRSHRPGFDSRRGNCIIFWKISFYLLKGLTSHQFCKAL